MFGLDSLIGNVVKAGTGLIKDYFPPDLSPEQKAKLEEGIRKAELEMNKQMNEYSKQVIKSQSDIIVAEAQGDSWLQRSWRPIVMLSFTAIIVNNYILFPYLSLFTDKAVILDIPEGMWSLLTAGLGGYVVGRSVEKSVKAYKGRV